MFYSVGLMVLSLTFEYLKGNGPFGNHNEPFILKLNCILLAILLIIIDKLFRKRRRNKA